MDQPLLTRLDHVTIVVHDLDAASARYEALLGHAPIWRGGHHELGTRAALFGLRNTLIELVGAAGDPAEGLRAHLRERGEGLSSLCFGTDDAGRLATTLRARSVRATPPEDGEARGEDGSLREYRTVELSARQTRGIQVFAVERALPIALPSEFAVNAFDALDHAAICTSNSDAAVALYGEGLGIRLALDRTFGPIRMLFFRVGGVTLEVIQDVTLAETDRFYGLTYRVRDLEGAHARLQAAGFTLSDIRTGNKPGTQVFSVRDGTCGVPTLVLRDPARD